MSDSGSARTAAYRPRPEAGSAPAVPRTGVAVYGCDEDEAALFRVLAPRLGVRVTVTDAPLCEATVDMVAGCRAISIGHRTEVTPPTLLALSRAGVEYISTRSIGTNHLDVDHAARLGIRVENVSYSPDSVADFTLMLMLMALRHARSSLRRTDAHDYRLGDVRGRELRDLTVGVVGTGRIGMAVIDRLRAFGCRIVANDKRGRDGVDYVLLDELLQRSDIVTLHTPLDASTHHLLDRRRIARMKIGAIIVNTGRGALLDTDALVSALGCGRLGGAALDVIEGEDGIFYADRSDGPVGNDALLRLQQLPNVIISPHSAFYTDHALRDTVENSLANCLSFENGDHRG